MIRKLIALLFLALCGVVLYVSRPLYLPSFAEFLIHDDPLRKADAIIVLAGDDVSGNRVAHAVSLWRDGWAGVVVLSGGWIARGVRVEDVMRRQAEEMGVLPDKIVVVSSDLPTGRGTLADSTLAEVRLFLAECRKRKFRTVIVVTSNFHTRRAKRIFEHAFAGSGTEIVVVASPDDSFKVDRWWTRRTDARTWLLEMEKLAFNYFEMH